MNEAQRLYEVGESERKKYLRDIGKPIAPFADSHKKKAIEAFHQAAKLGSKDAYYRLATTACVSLSSEQFSRTTDEKYAKSSWYLEAISYLESAAKLGHEDAIFCYGNYLLKYSENREQGIQWLEKAMANQHPEAFDVLFNYYKERELYLPLYTLLQKHEPKTDAEWVQWKHVDTMMKACEKLGYDDEYSRKLQLLCDHERITYMDIMVKKKMLQEQYEDVFELCKKMAKRSREYSYSLVENARDRLYLIAKNNQIENAAKRYWDFLSECAKEDPYKVWAEGYMGIAIAEGIGVEKDEKKGFTQLLELKKSGVGEYPYRASNLLGDYYYLGKVVPQDFAEAKKYYEAGTRWDKELMAYNEETKQFYCMAGWVIQPNDRSMWRIIETTYCNFKLGNYEDVVAQSTDSMMQDAPLAIQENLGWCYFNGKGTKVDYKKATEIFKKGVELNSAYSMYMLGKCHEVNKQMDLALEMQERAYATQATGIYAYEVGNILYIYKKDYVKAKEWYQKAENLQYSAATVKIKEIDKLLEEKRKAKEQLEKKAREEKAKEEKAKKQKEEDVIVLELDPKQQKELEEASRKLKKAADELKETLENGGAERLRNLLSPKENVVEEKVITYETSAKEELESLIGLDSVKQQVQSLERLIQFNAIRKSKGLSVNDISKHMVFTGNPGTGKTTVARIIAQIFKENGILSKGQLIETDRSGLVGQYIGETGQKTTTVVKSALGGVLFIDEAYALVPEDGGKDFGQEAIATLLKLMEDNKDDLVVIVAGYHDEMNRFIDSNPGMKSRFTTHIDFPDYKPEEMQQIFERLLKKGDYVLGEGATDKLMQLWATSTEYVNAGNGRAVRNVYEKAILNLSNRVMESGDIDDASVVTIKAEDIPSAESVFY